MLGVNNEQILNQEEKDKHFAYVCDVLAGLYSVKNARYNDSFSKQVKARGLSSVFSRLEDKVNRFECLAVQPNLDDVDESIIDTLQDLANYTIMTLMELIPAPSSQIPPEEV